MVESVSLPKPLVKNNKVQHKSMQQRSILLFNESIKSEKTRLHYIRYVNEFKDHFIIKSYDKLVAIEPKKIQEMLETFVMYQNANKHSLSYINAKLSALKLFFGMNDVVSLNWLKLRKMLPEKMKLTGDKPYKTEHIQLILKNTVSLKFRCIIHFLSSSGSRIGSFETMKLKHLQDMPNNCKSVLVYEDDKSEYSTFIHHEAVEALDEYLAYRTRMGEIITPNSWVIPATMDSSKPVTTASITTQMNRFT